MKRQLIALVMAVSVRGVFAEPPQVMLALRGLDPVELTQGKEVPGKAELTITRGRYKYQFTSAESKAVFEADPTAYALQFDGACARMGPLSGRCTSERWLVHDKRIYIFSSEACRTAFQKAPGRYLEAPEKPPTGTAEETKRGAQLVTLMLQGFGGADAVDGVSTLRTTYTIAYPQKGKADFLMKHEEVCAFPGRFREEDSYDAWSGANVATPEFGFATSKKVAWPLEDSVRAVIVRQFHREPLVLAKARNDKGFTAVARGKDKVGAAEVELIEIGVHGSTTTLALDPTTGRVVQARYLGRGDSALGATVKTYSDFKSIAKLTLAHAVTETFDGKAPAGAKRTLDKIAVNETIPATLFVKPE